MRAVTYTAGSAADAPEALLDVTLDKPQPRGRELLVEIRAVSVNPIDTKVRQGEYQQTCEPKVLGWDAAGIVVATGSDARLFDVGEEVFYAGALNAPGSHAEFQCVDERLVGRKPRSLDFASAAALPLTALTAWETLFDRLQVTSTSIPGAARAILIVGGAGGVGSTAIQLARKLTDLTVIATASRPETQAWCRDLGAHHVVDHARPLAAEVAALGLGAPGFIFSTSGTDRHLPELVTLSAPQGRLALIDDPATLDVVPLKPKSLSLHWELMFTRSLFETADLERQHEILNEISRLIDEGILRTTLGASFGTINADNLRRAHAHIESGRAQGKIVLEGFAP